MIKTINAPLLVDVETVEYQTVVLIKLDDVPIPDWCLNLSLLKEEMIDGLKVIGNKKLILKIDRTIDRSVRARVIISTGGVDIAFHPDEFDFLYSFFLRYYRDGVAEVDHLDIEGLTFPSESNGVEEVYLTFHVKDYVTPMSPQELRKLLAETD